MNILKEYEMKEKKNPGYRIREINIGFSPHYAFQVGDLLNDDKKQIVALHSTGSRLIALEHDGTKLWEKEISNADEHGVTALLIADVDGDGANEVVVGEHQGEENSVLILDKEGKIKRRVKLPKGKRDYANVAIDSFGLADINGDGFRELVVAVNGGDIYVLNREGEVILHINGLPDFFEHFVHTGDLDGDGMDEIFISASNAVDEESPVNHNLFYVIDQDGTVVWVRSLQEIGPDMHVDDVRVTSFLEGDQAQLFTSTGGCMFDRDGKLLWHLRDVLGHGQWLDCAKITPDRAGKQILISELWGFRHAMVLVDHDGTVLWTYDDVAKGAYPTRAHLIDWDGNGRRYAIFGEQPAPGSVSEKWQLKIAVVNAEGNEVLRIPFEDYRVKGWMYNFENSTKVIDIDGDGFEEFIFPTCKGTLMIVGRE